MTASRLAYSTDTTTAAEARRVGVEGRVVTCPSCEEEVRIFRVEPLAEGWICARCYGD